MTDDTFTLEELVVDVTETLTYCNNPELIAEVASRVLGKRVEYIGRPRGWFEFKIEAPPDE